jgi:hypothetical protein
MRTLRIGLVITLGSLQLVMKAPVWFLIARVDLTGGSSSYHRAELIDQFLRHFAQWWLIGTDQNGTWGLDMFDVQDQYVSVGLSGGLLGLVFFLLTISRSFSAIGRARLRIHGDRSREWKAWLLGCSMFASIVAFFGVNYFDQGRVIYFALLAMIAAFANQAAAANQFSDLPVEHNALLGPDYDELPSDVEGELVGS